jgi:hypothetical protein
MDCGGLPTGKPWHRADRCLPQAPCEVLIAEAALEAEATGTVDALDGG